MSAEKKKGKKSIKYYFQHFGDRLAARIELRRMKIDRYLELRRLRRLRHNTIPPYKNCKNCGTELKGTYCHDCGQYAHDTDQSFWNYIKIYLADTYLIDIKVIPTIRELLSRPGFLSQAFREGKINSYMNPLRLNMFLLIIVMAVILLSADNLFKWDTVEGVSPEQTEQTMSQVFTISHIFTDSNNIPYLANSPKIEVTLLAPLVSIEEYSKFMTIKERISCEISQNIDTMRVAIPAFLIEEELVAQTPNGEYMFVESNNIFNDQEMFNTLRSTFNSTFPLVALLLIPLLAIGIRLFNPRQHLTYTNHFVFAMHYVAFLQIFVLIVIIVPSSVLDIVSYKVNETIFILIPILYLTLAYRRFYQIGWIKSLFKAALTSISYWILVIFTILAILGSTIL